MLNRTAGYIHTREKRTCTSVKRARINNSGRQAPNQNQRGEVCGSVGVTSAAAAVRAPPMPSPSSQKNAGSCRATPPLRRPHVSRPDGDGRDRVGGGDRTTEPHVGPSEVEGVLHPRTQSHSSERQWAARCGCGTYLQPPPSFLSLSLSLLCRFNHSAVAFVCFRFTPTDSASF
jgi:hypothetical protein